MPDNNIWSEYWISPGMQVVHIHHMEKDDPKILYVERLIRKRIKTKTPSGESKTTTIVVGVLCNYWVGEKWTMGRFNTNELIPKEIADQGMDMINKWRARSYEQSAK